MSALNNAPVGAVNTAVQKPKFRNDLTAERVRELLDYDPNTGLFTWRVAGIRRPAGRPAGCVYFTTRGDRRVVIKVDGFLRRAHRLAWLHHFGRWPKGGIDHKDGDATNNRIENLREATHQQNMQNSKTPKNNSSGFKGVRRQKKTGKFESYIILNCKQKHLGTFPTKEQAAVARASAARQYFGDFVRASTLIGSIKPHTI